jgi:hypothetical protein
VECQTKYEKLMKTSFFSMKMEKEVHPDTLPQRERLNVMGVTYHSPDGRNFVTTIAVVD